MTTRRTPIHRGARRRITPEVVAAYVAARKHQDLYYACVSGKACRSQEPGRHCDECRAHIDATSELDRLLGLRPWECSPLEVPDECRRDGTAWAASLPQARALREQIEAELMDWERR